ncbi:MAG TPA: toll/interleukin-1 receptor domain-containing protein [Sphingomicrobium sp.]|nr:toll/interleukin-1 receptor domain-containing protein [Sphingomicrobium sp.]
MNKWTRPRERSRALARPAGGRRAASAHHYFAFLSYSHNDAEDADWLHDELERFRVPASLSGKLTANGVIPKRLSPIFRDRHELAAADDLGEEIREALAASRCMIVLCSPAAAKSKWTNAEIDAFKRIHPDGCIIAAVIAGEPLASESPGREDDECFPPALRAKYDRRGRPTGKTVEPLAADLREGRGGRRIGFLKIVAGILGIGLDDLVQRDQLRRQRRLAGIAAGSLAGMVIASALAITAIEARDAARDQRREAEGLVAFMLGDLKDKLEPIGRLDALDGVGSKVLAYYHKQDTSQLSDAALLQRSRALSLMGEVANLRGDISNATRFYREAMAGTAEAIRRSPDDPERLFDHAQNVFYFGEMALLRGNKTAAETAMREYKRLAGRMIALQPDNMRWRMEAQYADFNLGVVLYGQRRFGDAAVAFQQALQRIEALATADPSNADYQRQLPDALAWVSDAKLAEGKIAETVAVRERHVALLERLLSQGNNDIYYRLRLVKANQMLGQAYADQGRLDDGISRLRSAVQESERLIALEPSNTRTLELAFKARLELARLSSADGNRGEAETQTRAGCAIVSQLLARDHAAPAWQAGLRDCWIMRARNALAEGSKEGALSSAQRSLEVARRISSSESAEDELGVAKSYRILGDIQRTLGNEKAANDAWTSAYAAYPKGVAELPAEVDERAAILQRLGRGAEAEQLRRRLIGMGFQFSDAS